jgi:hypothetical protein
MEITRDRKLGFLFFCQHDYNNKVLNHFNMPNERKSQHLLHHTLNYHLLNVLLLMKILNICLQFNNLVLLVLLCMPWFVLALICHIL